MSASGLKLSMQQLQQRCNRAVRTRQSCDANARFSRAFFRNEALNAVLHLSELSNQLDVTLESSKIVKLALNWVATTQSDTIK
jgi:hypothetical protein